MLYCKKTIIQRNSKFHITTTTVLHRYNDICATVRRRTGPLNSLTHNHTCNPSTKILTSFTHKIQNSHYLWHRKCIKWNVSIITEILYPNKGINIQASVQQMQKYSMHTWEVGCHFAMFNVRLTLKTWLSIQEWWWRDRIILTFSGQYLNAQIYEFYSLACIFEHLQSLKCSIQNKIVFTTFARI